MTRHLFAVLAAATALTLSTTTASAQSSWIEKAQWIGTPSLPAGAALGSSIGISGDNVVVGASIEGVAYVLSSSSGGLRFVQRIEAPDGIPGELGEAVDIDGNRLIIGREYDDIVSFNSGSAYIYRLDGDTWVLEDKLIPSDAFQLDNFGCSVAIDGDRAIIGAQFDDDRGTSSGAAYIFERFGTQWIQTEKLVARQGGEGDLAGWAVDLDGNVAVVGAWGNSSVNLFGGATYVYEYSPSGWNQTGTLRSPMPQDDLYFGVSVAASEGRIAVGATGRGGRRGAAHVFTRDSLGWSLEQSWTPTLARGTEFGNSLSFDGDLLVIGAHRQGNFNTRGVVYLAERTSLGWSALETLEPNDPPKNGRFGWAVDFDGNKLVSTAIAADPGGEVFLFERRVGLGSGKKK
ncbi:MAG: FG-GAP repeat protein [Planctomycetota bacterium]